MLSFSKSSTSNTVNNVADSYNVSTGRTEVLSEVGNTDLTFNTPGTDLNKLLPFAALACFAFAAWLLVRK